MFGHKQITTSMIHLRAELLCVALPAAAVCQYNNIHESACKTVYAGSCSACKATTLVGSPQPSRVAVQVWAHFSKPTQGLHFVDASSLYDAWGLGRRLQMCCIDEEMTCFLCLSFMCTHPGATGTTDSPALVHTGLPQLSRHG